MPMADDSYFDDDSMLRRVQGERMLMISGPRALLMQAAHPLAVEGLLAHTAGLDDPYDAARAHRRGDDHDRLRLPQGRRSGDQAGPRDAPPGPRERSIATLGSSRRGLPYAADDPELLMWVLFSLVDSGIVVYERFVGATERG